jgi:isopenicillin N synthase-like dioxygenase
MQTFQIHDHLIGSGDDTHHLPVINLEVLRLGTDAERRTAAGALGAACRETGFFCVSRHGISPAIRTALFAAAHEFFAMPIGRKNELSISRSRHNRGYVQIGTERLEAQSPPDQKEAFNIGLELPADDAEVLAGRPLRGVNFWPDLPGWRQLMLAYYDQCLEIGRTLHRGFCLDLGLPEDFFAPTLVAPAASLRLLHYPSHTAKTSEAPGAGEHTDYGNITLLATDGVAGLEVRRRDGTWIPVADTGELLLCNIGDCLMRWTNDEYVSTPHRVRVPTTERYSIAFFLDPNPDATVDPSLVRPHQSPRYAPVSVRDYLLSRFDATYDLRNKAATA